MPYIVVDNEAIWGLGETADAAWNDMLAMMALNDTTVIADDVDSETIGPDNWCRASSFRLLAATPDLVEAVRSRGCAISFEIHEGVAGLPQD